MGLFSCLDKGLVGSQKYLNLDLEWVNVMVGEFGEFTGFVGLVMHLLASGSRLLGFCDASSHTI